MEEECLIPVALYIPEFLNDMMFQIISLEIIANLEEGLRVLLRFKYVRYFKSLE